MNSEHFSVLADEVIQYLSECQCRFVVDGTLGAGGHALRILEKHPEIDTYIGIDQDPTALEIAKNRLIKWKDKLHLIKGNFSSLEEHLKTLHVKKVDAILLDLGVSSMQLDRPEKGFSFMRDGPLDMRMDPDASPSALEVVNEFSESELGRIFRQFGEEKLWRGAAKLIVEARKKEKIETTMQLSDILMPLLGWKRSKGSQPMAQIFQGIRIFVNKELEVIEKVLPQAIDLLNAKGRLAIITFHSLEDRLVKEAFRQAASDKEDTEGIGGGLFSNKVPTVKILTRRPVCPSEEEIKKNPRSRSAKLRVIEKL